MTPAPEPKIKVGDKIQDKFLVKKKIGEGSCGQVFLLESIKNSKSKYALKLEPRLKSKDDEILRMEIYVLKKMQGSRHVARFYGSGKLNNFSYVIMSLLGKDLYDLRRKCPNRKIGAGSVLRVGIQGLQALEDLHAIGFVHRDVKPSNLCMGFKNTQLLFLLDFGLARQIMMQEKNGKMKLREPRQKVSFRGTVRYCSLNVHLGKEQGRHDDLYGLIYSLIEAATGTLPWKGSTRTQAEKTKTTTPQDVVLKGCPASFTDFYDLIKKLSYNDKPEYARIKATMAKNIQQLGVKITDPYDWDLVVSTDKKEKKKADAGTPSCKENAEKDTGDDNTNKDVDDSIASANSDTKDDNGACDAEDTLDNVADVTHEQVDNQQTKE